MPATPEKEINLIEGLLKRFEKHPLVEVTETPQIPPEIQTYVQKVETLTPTQPPLMIGGKSTPVSKNPQPIVLPLTASQYVQSQKSGVYESIRWLAAWCLRLLKIYGSRVSFRPGPNL